VARMRVAVLEWPADSNADAGSGPPPSIRIGTDAVLALARKAGCSAAIHKRLTRMDFYTLAP